MKNNKLKQAKKVTIISAIINVFLSMIKIIIGSYANSGALVADGFHSLSDLVTDFIVIFGLNISSKPPDEKHPYGHGRIEDIVSLFLGLFLVAVAVSIAFNAGNNIYVHKVNKQSLISIFCLIAAIIAKEFIYYYSIIVAKKINSESLLINAWHHRTDSLSSIGVLIGVVGGLISDKLLILDSFAALIISLLIFKVGIVAIWKTIVKLIDTSVPLQTRNDILKIILSFKKIKGHHKLMTRYVGNNIIVDLHIQVDGSLSVSEGHEIASKLKDKIQRNVPNIINVLIHVEPFEDIRCLLT